MRGRNDTARLNALVNMQVMGGGSSDFAQMLFFAKRKVMKRIPLTNANVYRINRAAYRIALDEWIRDGRG